jgi:hypothetical protein
VSKKKSTAGLPLKSPSVGSIATVSGRPFGVRPVRIVQLPTSAVTRYGGVPQTIVGSPIVFGSP